VFDGRGVTIRYAYPDDEPAVRRLAQLDESAVPTGRVLLAEVGDELWAAAAINGSAPIADPFRPSEALAGMLLDLNRRARI
jgi:hypothetical protein